MEQHSEGRSGASAARRAVSYWYRVGLALAEANPPLACAHAYALGRRMAALRKQHSRRGAARVKRGDSPCHYCQGIGEVSGVVDDLEFTFQCPCAGGVEEPVRWLLGAEWEASPDDDEGI